MSSPRNKLSNLRIASFLKHETGVHTHVDLIAGLPGEDLESFAMGFDELAALEPDEIQVGILKHLKGTPIMRYDQDWAMVYSQTPPFQILSTKVMDSETLLKMQRFSEFWDLIANSGNFLQTMKEIRKAPSLFAWFWDLTDFLSVRHPLGHSIHLLDLFRSLLIYFEEVQRRPLRELLEMDYLKDRPGPTPKFLRSESAPRSAQPLIKAEASHLPKRQRLHQNP
jgi:hypothetical protein